MYHYHFAHQCIFYAAVRPLRWTQQSIASYCTLPPPLIPNEIVVAVCLFVAFYRFQRSQVQCIRSRSPTLSSTLLDSCASPSNAQMYPTVAPPGKAVVVQPSL